MYLKVSLAKQIKLTLNFLILAEQLIMSAKWSPSQAKAHINSLVKRGWIWSGNKLLTPAEAKLQNKVKATQKNKVVQIKTGWIDDTRNIANKGKTVHLFIQLIKQQFCLEVWPEFYFSTQRNYRIDFAIPVNTKMLPLKIAIEVNGGIWARGNSGHSSGTGIKRDMEKANLLVSAGWRLISVEPDELVSNKVLELIKAILSQ